MRALRHAAASQDFTAIVGDIGDGLWDIMELADDGFVLPPPALDFEGGIDFALPHGLVWERSSDVELENASTAMDQSSRTGSVRSSMDSPMSEASSNASVCATGGVSSLTTPAQVATPPCATSPSFFLAEACAEVEASAATLTFRQRKDRAILALLLPLWAAATPRASATTVPRLKVPISAGCAHRVGGRRVALRASRRVHGARGTKRAPRRPPQQAACVVRHGPRNCEVAAAIPFIPLRRAFRGGGRPTHGFFP